MTTEYDTPSTESTTVDNGFSISDLSAWKKVRHVPGTGNWHPAVDHLDGT